TCWWRAATLSATVSCSAPTWTRCAGTWPAGPAGCGQRMRGEGADPSRPVQPAVRRGGRRGGAGRVPLAALGQGGGRRPPVSRRGRPPAGRRRGLAGPEPRGLAGGGGGPPPPRRGGGGLRRLGPAGGRRRARLRVEKLMAE